MLAAAAIGVAVMSKEGLAVETMQAADLLMPDITSTLELLEKPLRMVASLRR
jgi:soluble P-type ATPase